MIRVQGGRLTLMNLELDFRWHIGGDMGQRIELRNQHSLSRIHHSPCARGYSWLSVYTETILLKGLVC